MEGSNQQILLSEYSYTLFIHILFYRPDVFTRLCIGKGGFCQFFTLKYLEGNFLQMLYDLPFSCITHLFAVSFFNLQFLII